MSHSERGRGTEETSMECLSSMEFSVGLIVLSKDQDEGRGHVNIVSLQSLILCFTVLLIFTAGPFYVFVLCYTLQNINKY